MAEIDDLTVSDSGNTARFYEGQAPSTVNNGARALEGLLARGIYDILQPNKTTGGSANAQTLTPNRTIAAIADGMAFTWKAGFTNTGAMTLDVDDTASTGAVTVKDSKGNDLVAGAVTAGGYYTTIYNGTNHILGAIPSSVGSHTIAVPAGAMIPRTTSGAASKTTETATNKVMLKTLDFDKDTDEFAQFCFPAPKSWDEGTMTAQFIWTAGATGDVVWGIQGLSRSDGDAVDTAFGTARTATDSVTSANDTMVSAMSAAITLSGTPAEGDMLYFQVYRDANNASDTLAADASLIAVRLIYKINTPTDD